MISSAISTCGLGRQGPGDRDPLALTAGQLAREQARSGPRPGRPGRAAGRPPGPGLGGAAPVPAERLRQRLADGHPRVEARSRGPGRPSAPAGGRPAAGRPAAGRCPRRAPGPGPRSARPPDDGPGQRRLARAGLADQAEDLALRQLQLDVVDGDDLVGRRRTGRSARGSPGRVTAGSRRSTRPPAAALDSGASRRRTWPGSERLQTGGSRSAAVDGVRAARRERAAVRDLARLRRPARDRRRADGRGRWPCPAPRRSAPGCTGGPARTAARRRRASSTTRPAYMTSDPLAQLGDHGDVVRDEQDRRGPGLVADPAQQLEDLLLHGHVERASSARRR